MPEPAMPLERKGLNAASSILARLIGPVVHGFGRGSKDLGCPTANLEIVRGTEDLSENQKTVRTFVDAATPGVYMGFAQVRRKEEKVFCFVKGVLVYWRVWGRGKVAW